jgi:CBS domain containing-hemolysin-like protein
VNDWLLVAIGLILTIGTGCFVAAEFALVNLDRRDLEARRERGEKGLDRTIDGLKITSTHLSSAQLGITLTTLLTGYTLEPAISALLRDPLLRIGVSEGLVRGVGAIVGITLATFFSMIVGELIPKNFALALPLATAKVVMPFQAAFTRFFKPLILLFNNTANAIVRSLGIEPKEELSGARSAEELSALVRHSALAGMLDEGDAALIHRTLRFSDRIAAEVMTPRVMMNTIERETTLAQIVALAERTGHSRFPVIGESIDDIVGVVHIKHAFAKPLAEWNTLTAADIMTAIERVPETMDIDVLLARLRVRGFQIVVVVDEYGGTSGIVTLEDVVEELVGELRDEHDRAQARIIRSGRSLSFPAAFRPDELFDRTGITIPDDGDYETAAGFIAEQLDRVPIVGDEVEIEGGVLRVDRMVGARLERLRFIPDDPDLLSEESETDRLRDQLIKEATRE